MSAPVIFAKRLWPSAKFTGLESFGGIMTKRFLRLALAVMGAVALLALAAKEVRAMPVQIDLGATGVLNGANPETNKIAFNGLNGTPVVGSIAVDFLFTNNEFVRLFTATQPLFDALIHIQTNGSGFLGSFVSGTGHLIDAHGNAIPGFGVIGSADFDDASLSIGLLPLLKDMNGTPNDQLQRPLDFSGVHFDFTFPSNPSVTVTGGEFKLVGNGTFTPFGIGPGVPADIVSDSGSTIGLLALSIAGIVGIRILSGSYQLSKRGATQTKTRAHA